MPGLQDQINSLKADSERSREFIDHLVEQAEGRDLTEAEMSLIAGATTEMRKANDMAAPLIEAARLTVEGRDRWGSVQRELAPDKQRTPVEYRSAGAYIADLYAGGLGDADARQRLEVFNRAAAHQTTTDNPGLLPENIVGPIVNFVDSSRPIVSTIGPTDLGTGSWAYARVTQHTQVAAQSAEKAEMASRKMLITKTAITAPTYGGYVNVSRQDISRTVPGIMDMVVADLAGQYAIVTEAACATDMTAAATAGPAIPASPTGANVATAIYTAAGSVFTATQGQGRIVVALSPDQLGIIAPLFAPVNPQNAFSPGFDATPAFGANGSIGGLTIVMSAGLAADTILVFSTAAVRCFESRYGALQVVEPSVWGVQVGYAGDFETVVVEATGIVRVTTA